MIKTPIDYIVRISENILTSSYENFDQETLENAKKRIIDVLGCLISGAGAAGNSGLIDLVKDWGGREEATILVYGGKAPVHNVVLANSMMARSYDFETVGALVEGVDYASHISGTTVTTALSLGEFKDISGKELITALLVGDDIACRLVAASISEFAMGWDWVGIINAFGATAIAARLLGLTIKQIQNAFGIVLSQLSGSFQNIWDGAATFKLLQGLSAKNGILSAELSKAGLTGPEDALFSKFGYFHLYTKGCRDPEILIKDLGKKYYAEATFKVYPCCRANHAAIDCALNIVNTYAVENDRIDEIIIYVSPMVRNMFVGQPFKIREIPQIDAAFNIRYCVASVLLRKTISLEHFQENMVRDPEIRNIVNKIKIEEQERLEQKLGASVKVKMKDGKELFSNVDYAKSDPLQSPLSIEEIKKKFMNNVTFAQNISEENAEKILTLIDNLEKMDSIHELIKLLST